MVTITGNGKGTDAAARGGKKSDCITGFVDEGSVESSRYYYSRRTVCEMLRDRGYDVPGSDLTCSLAEFRCVFGEQPNLESLRICVSLHSDPSNKVLVIFLGTANVNIETIRGIHDQIVNKEKSNRLMLILQSKMTAYAQKEMGKCPFKVEIIKINDLLVNITKHVLEPKYEVVTADEKRKLLEKYKLEETQLPYMQETDAIARYYGLEKGQVVKITHGGELVDYFVTYRCVV